MVRRKRKSESGGGGGADVGGVEEGFIYSRGGSGYPAPTPSPPPTPSPQPRDGGGVDEERFRKRSPAFNYYLASKLGLSLPQVPLEEVRHILESVFAHQENWLRSAGITREELDEAGYIYRVLLAFEHAHVRQGQVALAFPELGGEMLGYTAKWLFDERAINPAALSAFGSEKDAVDFLLEVFPPSGAGGEPAYSDVLLVLLAHAAPSLTEEAATMLQNAFLQYAVPFSLRLAGKVASRLDEQAVEAIRR